MPNVANLVENVKAHVPASIGKMNHTQEPSFNGESKKPKGGCDGCCSCGSCGKKAHQGKHLDIRG